MSKNPQASTSRYNQDELNAEIAQTEAQARRQALEKQNKHKEKAKDAWDSEPDSSDNESEQVNALTDQIEALLQQGHQVLNASSVSSTTELVNEDTQASQMKINAYFQKEREAIQKEREELDRARAAIKEKERALESQASLLNTKANEVFEQLEQDKAQLAAAWETFSAEKETLEQSGKMLQAERKKVAQEAEKLKAERARVKNELTKLQTKIGKLEGDRNQLKDQLKNVATGTQAYEKAKKELDSINEQLKASEKEKEETKRSMEALTQEQKENKNHAERLKGEMEQLQSSLAKTQNENQELQAKQAEMNVLTLELEAKRKQAEQQTEQAKEQAKRAQAAAKKQGTPIVLQSPEERAKDKVLSIVSSFIERDLSNQGSGVSDAQADYNDNITMYLGKFLAMSTKELVERQKQIEDHGAWKPKASSKGNKETQQEAHEQKRALELSSGNSFEEYSVEILFQKEWIKLYNEILAGKEPAPYTPAVTPQTHKLCARIMEQCNSIRHNILQENPSLAMQKEDFRFFLQNWDAMMSILESKEATPENLETISQALKPLTRDYSQPILNQDTPETNSLLIEAVAALVRTDTSATRNQKNRIVFEQWLGLLSTYANELSEMASGFQSLVSITLKEAENRFITPMFKNLQQGLLPFGHGKNITAGEFNVKAQAHQFFGQTKDQVNLPQSNPDFVKDRENFVGTLMENFQEQGLDKKTEQVCQCLDAIEQYSDYLKSFGLLAPAYATDDGKQDIRTLLWSSENVLSVAQTIVEDLLDPEEINRIGIQHLRAINDEKFASLAKIKAIDSTEIAKEQDEPSAQPTNAKSTWTGALSSLIWGQKQ